MDGRQRLSALREFYDDDFALDGLQYWSELDGKRYSQLPSKVRAGIDRRYISSIILLKETAASEEKAARLRKLVFERLNTGGVQLSSQETRNAVHDGPLNQLCLALSEDQRFREMWRIPLDPRPEESDADEMKQVGPGLKMYRRMEDVELVLRFFAYRVIGQFKSAGLNTKTTFLDRFIAVGNRFSIHDIEEYRSLFDGTINFLWNALEKDAFAVLKPKKKAPSKIVYDSIMFAAASPEVRPHWNALTETKNNLRKRLEAMYESNQDLFSGRRTNLCDTQDRNACVCQAFAAAITSTKN